MSDLDRFLEVYNGIKLIETCGACPEQYDAMVDGEKHGYLRLRHGYFRVKYDGEVIYEASTKGDGSFDSDERDKYLNEAKMALAKYHVDKELPDLNYPDLNGDAHDADT